MKTPLSTDDSLRLKTRTKLRRLKAAHWLRASPYGDRHATARDRHRINLLFAR